MRGELDPAAIAKVPQVWALTKFRGDQLAPARNLHLIMGNISRRPYQFIVIGVLRTTADLEQVDDQWEQF